MKYFLLILSLVEDGRGVNGGKNRKEYLTTEDTEITENFITNGARAETQNLQKGKSFPIFFEIHILLPVLWVLRGKKRGGRNLLPLLDESFNFLFQPAVLPIENIRAVGQGGRLEVHPLGTR